MCDVKIDRDERFDRINERLCLIQKKDGLTFGTDAYLLAAFVNTRGTVCAELGAGTGAASLLCASRGKAKRIYAVEVQESFAELCGRNAKLNGFSDIIIPICSDVRDIGPQNTGGEVDAVFANPPYMRNDSGRGNGSSEKNIARREVFGGIGDFCAAAARILKYGGDFYAVYRSERLSELMCAMSACGLEPKRLIVVYPNAGAKPCLVLVRARKGAKPGLEVSPPLVIYREKNAPSLSKELIGDGERDLGYTASFARIYRDFSLEHLF